MNYVTDHMRRELANHVLTLTHNGGAVRHYRLGPPDTNMGEVRLIFTSGPLPEQVIVTGDLNPREHGVASQQGYGLGWFGRRQGESYLCEKFLREGYYPEHAMRWMRGALEDAEANASVRKIAVLKGALESPELVTNSHESFYEWLRDVYRTDPEDEGFGYDPKVAGALAAVQQTFARLYGEMQQARPTQPLPVPDVCDMLRVE